jgi:hypothetical protein
MDTPWPAAGRIICGFNLIRSFFKDGGSSNIVTPVIKNRKLATYVLWTRLPNLFREINEAMDLNTITPLYQGKNQLYPCFPICGIVVAITMQMPLLVQGLKAKGKRRKEKGERLKG